MPLFKMHQKTREYINKSLWEDKRTDIAYKH